MDEIINIPWGKILANFVWILGFSIIVSDLCFHEFLAYREKAPLITVLKKGSFKKPFLWGVFLFALGVCFSTGTPWLAAIAGGAAMLFLIFLLKKIKTKP